MKEIKVRCRGVIVHEGKMLVVRHREGDTFFALPGGRLDVGESPLECIVRELTEELGVIPVIGRLLYVNSFMHKEQHQSIEFIFEVRNGVDFLAYAEKERTHAYELVEVVWVEPTHSLHILPEKIGEDFKNGVLFSDTVRFLSE